MQYRTFHFYVEFFYNVIEDFHLVWQ